LKFFGVITASPNRFFQVYFSGIRIQLGPDLRPVFTGGFLRGVRRFVPTFALFVASVFCLHCAKPAAGHRTGVSNAPMKYIEEQAYRSGRARQMGYASWYGNERDGFHYKKTANGETMMPDAWTCAHPFLPFGAIVRVENLSNKRSALLRVNDRGPYVKGRIIDLSLRGAMEIGIVNSGIAKVSVHVVKNILRTNTTDAPSAIRRPMPAPENTPPVFNIDLSGAVRPFANNVLNNIYGRVSSASHNPLSSFFQSLEEALNRFKNRRFEPFIRKR